MRYVLVGVAFLFMACEGFKFEATMCDSLQPGEVSIQCRAYSEEEAQKATEHKLYDKGECLKCKKSQKIEIRK